MTDGSVVLGAVDSEKTTTILFRVRRTLLTDQSEVFASMFSLPQGEGNCQTDCYDGLPFVQLHDTAEEVVALLDVLRDPLCAILLFERFTDFQTIFQILQYFS